MHRRTLLAAAAAIAAAGPAFAQASGPVQVGAIEILSGPNAAYGTAIRAGLHRRQEWERCERLDG